MSLDAEKDAIKVAQANVQTSLDSLMRWVTSANAALEGGKLDGATRARIGELLINACKHLDAREVAARHALRKAEIDSDPETLARKKYWADTRQAIRAK